MDLNMKLDVKVKDKEFNGSIRDITHINEETLTDEFINQPSMYAWFAALSAIASGEVESKKFELSVLRANLDGEKRALLEVEGKKVTETMVNSAIITDKKFIAVNLELIDLERQLEILKALTRALEQRCTMLVQLGSTRRQELSSDISINLEKVRKNQ